MNDSRHKPRPQLDAPGLKRKPAGNEKESCLSEI